MMNAGYEAKTRAAAMAAELVLSSGMLLADAAKQCGVSRSSVSQAKTILTLGTPEEVSAMKAGKLGLRLTADAIRANLTPEQRHAQRTVPRMQRGQNPEKVQAQQVRGRVWSQLRGALDGICELPSPSDVVALMGKKETAFIDARLSRALNWLKEFSNDWANRDQAQADAEARGDLPHPGNSDRAA